MTWASCGRVWYCWECNPKFLKFANISVETLLISSLWEMLMGMNLREKCSCHLRQQETIMVRSRQTKENSPVSGIHYDASIHPFFLQLLSEHTLCTRRLLLLCFLCRQHQHPWILTRNVTLGCHPDFLVLKQFSSNICLLNASEGSWDLPKFKICEGVMTQDHNSVKVPFVLGCRLQRKERE